MPVTYGLESLLGRLHSEKFYDVSTHLLRVKLAHYSSIFTDHKQHDSWEALGFLIKALTHEWTLLYREVDFSKVTWTFEDSKRPAKCTVRMCVEFHLSDLIKTKVLAGPVACFYGMHKNTTICHECKETRHSLTPQMGVEVSWNCVRSKVSTRVILDGCMGEVLRIDGIDESNTLLNVAYHLKKLTGKFFVFFLTVSAGKTHEELDLKIVESLDTKLGDLNEHKRLALFAYMETTPLEPPEDPRLLLCLKLEAEPPKWRHRLAVVSNRDLLAESSDIRSQCLNASRDVTAEEFDVYVICGGNVIYDLNKRYWLNKTKEPLIVAILPPGFWESEAGRKLSAPQLQPTETKPKTLDEVCSILAQVYNDDEARERLKEFNEQSPVKIPLDLLSDIAKSQIEAYQSPEFIRWLRTGLGKYYKKLIAEHTPIVTKHDVFPKEGELKLKECLESTTLDHDYTYDRSFCKATEGCKSLTCTKRSSIVVPPQVMLVHLNRFGDGSSSMDDRAVVCPLTLEWHDTAYEMVSAVFHSNSSAHYGHYTAIVRNRHTKMWFKANDSIITPLGKEPDVKTASVVGYERVKRKSGLDAAEEKTEGEGEDDEKKEDVDVSMKVRK